MDKFAYRILQSILLCIIFELSFTCDRSIKCSSVRIHKEDQGEILLFLINVGVHKVGKVLDKGYRCPLYCDVNHKHIYWEVYEKKTNRKENNLQAIARIHRAIRDTSKE